MSFGKWQLQEGKWVSVSLHTVQDQPTSYGIVVGCPPAAIIKSSLEIRKQENLRRFDKPSEDQIKALIYEDQRAICKQNDVTQIVKEAKEDLKTGKLKISPDVLKERDKRFVPFSSVVDEQGVTHVLPQDKVKEYNSPEEVYQKMKSEGQWDKQSFIIEDPQPANLPAVSERSVIENALNQIRIGRDQFRRRTII